MWGYFYSYLITLPIVALELTLSSPYLCCGVISFFISIDTQDY
jgi:hypothetical protein